MTTTVKFGMLVLAAALTTGCAGARTAARSTMEPQVWAAAYKRQLADYRAARTPEQRNAAIDALAALEPESPGGQAAARLREDLALMGAAEGRADILGDLGDTETAKTLLR